MYNVNDSSLSLLSEYLDRYSVLGLPASLPDAADVAEAGEPYADGS